MSWYNTVVLSFSEMELDQAEDPHDFSRDCEQVRKIDGWLRRQGYDTLLDLAESLATNVVMFGGTYNKLLTAAQAAKVSHHKMRA